MQSPFHAIDIKIVDPIQSSNIAYYRLDDGMAAFIQKCMDEYKVIGFAWEGTRNFGIILGEKKVEPKIKDNIPAPKA